jgi:hypothetical protein
MQQFRGYGGDKLVGPGDPVPQASAREEWAQMIQQGSVKPDYSGTKRRRMWRHV